MIGMKVSEAARKVGASESVIRDAINAGELQSTVMDLPNSGQCGHGPTNVIMPGELDRWWRMRKPFQRKHKWTDERRAALLEIIQTCTAAQAAEYFGVTELSVRNILHRLMVAGEYTGVGHRKMSPHVVPSTGILLAKSCCQCGKLREAKYFPRTHNKGTSHQPSCSVCRNEQQRQRKWQGMSANMQLLQDISYENAHRRGAEWTEPEDRAIADLTQSPFDLAITLGRTLNGINIRRSRTGLTSPRNPSQPDTFWVIQFGPGQTAIEEHFRKLGEPVPESLWEWTDEDLEVSA